MLMATLIVAYILELRSSCSIAVPLIYYSGSFGRQDIRIVRIPASSQCSGWLWSKEMTTLIDSRT
jgi:hypothetical protein